MIGPAPVRQRPPLLRSVLGDVLRRARLGQGRTLADVAARARVSVPYLSEVERGRKEASSEVLAAVTTALGMTLVDLAGGVARDLSRAADARAAATRRSPWGPTTLDLTSAASSSTTETGHVLAGAWPAREGSVRTGVDGVVLLRAA